MILRSMVLMLLVCSVCAVELSEDANEAKAEYEEAINEIIVETTDEIDEGRADLVKALEKELKSVTKKGDLAAAQAVQAKIDEYRKKEAAPDLFGQQEPGADAGKATQPAGNEGETKAEAAKASFILVNATVRVHEEGLSKDVTALVQALIDEGRTSINPKKDLSKATGIENRAALYLEVKTADGIKKWRTSWFVPIDIESGERVQ